MYLDWIQQSSSFPSPPNLLQEPATLTKACGSYLILSFFSDYRAKWLIHIYLRYVFKSHLWIRKESQDVLFDGLVIDATLIGICHHQDAVVFVSSMIKHDRVVVDQLMTPLIVIPIFMVQSRHGASGPCVACEQSQNKNHHVQHHIFPRLMEMAVVFDGE